MPTLTTTARNLKAAAAHQQIAALRIERDRLVDSWLERGLEATQELCEAISEQIVSLYEEIDALEAGETRCPAQPVAADVAVLDGRSLAELGWTEADLARHERKAARKLARR